MAEEEIRQKYMELQMAAEQLKQMQVQMQTLETKGQELDANIQSFEELKGQKSSEMLTPIAEGIFLKAELKSDSEVIVNVGAGVCGKRTVEEAKKMLQERQREINQYATEMTAEVEKIAEAMRKLEQDLSSMVKKKG